MLIHKVPGVVPDFLQQQSFCHNPVGVGDQKPEDLKFRRCHSQRFSLQGGCHGIKIYLQTAVIVLDPLPWACRSPSQGCLKPSVENRHFKGFCDIVIRSAVKPPHLVPVHIPGSEKYDGNVLFRFYGSAEVKPVTVRQVAVQEDQIYLIFTEDRHALTQGQRGVYFVVFCFQVIGEACVQVFVIFDQQYFIHRLLHVPLLYFQGFPEDPLYKSCNQYSIFLWEILSRNDRNHIFLPPHRIQPNYKTDTIAVTGNRVCLCFISYQYVFQSVSFLVSASR